MKLIITITSIIACSILLFAATAIQANEPMTFTVMGNVYTSETSSENFFDEFGYGGGIGLTLSPYIGVVGLFEYQPDVFQDYDRYDLSAYGAVTLAKFNRLKFAGIGGFEWYTSKLEKIEFNDPYFAFGVLGQYDLYEGFGGWTSVTNTLVDNSDLFDNLKVRLGLKYTF